MLKSSKIIITSQDSNRKWVLLFATICTVASIISLVSIYQRKSGNLKDTWTDNIGQNITYFVTIHTGWSNNKIGK